MDTVDEERDDLEVETGVEGGLLLASAVLFVLCAAVYLFVTAVIVSDSNIEVRTKAVSNRAECVFKDGSVRDIDELNLSDYMGIYVLDENRLYLTERHAFFPDWLERSYWMSDTKDGKTY